MTTKSQRHNLIIKIISDICISNQELLQKELLKKGVDVTQATLSRDMRQLPITKICDAAGNLKYVLTTSPEFKSRMQNFQPENSSFHPSGFLSLSFSGNMAVIKTRNGYASALAFDIDMSNITEIIGTIAGSDTVFCVIRENVSHSDVKKSLLNCLQISDDFCR